MQVERVVSINGNVPKIVQQDSFFYKIDITLDDNDQ